MLTVLQEPRKASPASPFSAILRGQAASSSD